MTHCEGPTLPEKSQVQESPEQDNSGVAIAVSSQLYVVHAEDASIELFITLGERQLFIKSCISSA